MSGNREKCVRNPGSYPQTYCIFTAKNFNSTNQYLVGAYTPPDGITVIGGKTGHTNTAGYNLVVLVQDSHHKEYVAVILGATTKDELYNQMNTLLSKI